MPLALDSATRTGADRWNSTAPRLGEVPPWQGVHGESWPTATLRSRLVNSIRRLVANSMSECPSKRLRCSRSEMIIAPCIMAVAIVHVPLGSTAMNSLRGEQWPTASHELHLLYHEVLAWLEEGASNPTGESTAGVHRLQVGPSAAHWHHSAFEADCGLLVLWRCGSG